MINSAHGRSKVRDRPHSLRFAIRDSRFGLRNSLSTFILAVTCMCALTTAADELQMTKIVFRRMSPDIAPDSFAAKPRMLYRVADKYSRIEEPLTLSKAFTFSSSPGSPIAGRSTCSIRRRVTSSTQDQHSPRAPRSSGFPNQAANRIPTKNSRTSSSGMRCDFFASIRPATWAYGRSRRRIATRSP